MNKTNRQRKICWQTMKKWFEPIGLVFLLVAFGWQFFEGISTQTVIEGYFLETNEKLLAIWEGIYDEAIHSERYEGETIGFGDYDSINSSIKGWNQVKEKVSTLEKQENMFFWIRVVLYIIGSCFIVVAKLPNSAESDS